MKSVKDDVSYHFNLISIMQTEDIDGLIPPSFDKSLRKVIVRIILILSDEMTMKQRKKLVQIAKNHYKSKGEEEQNTTDVNKIVGWAIYNLRFKKIRAKKSTKITMKSDYY